MKKHIARTTLKATGLPIVCIPYGDAQYLLRYKNADYYNAGIYGWNFDAYIIDGVIITTGYRNMHFKRVEFVQEYEQKAYTIASNPLFTYSIKEDLISRVLSDFVDRVKSEF